MVEPGADPAEVYAYDNEETMAYISNYGVRTLMSMVLKDIVVNKPADPITYMIDMCKNLAEDDYLPPPDEDEMLAYDDTGRGGTQISGEELQEMVLEMFLQADDDRNGYLDRGEFKRILQSAELNLSKKDIRNVMAECDENDDGVIEYREFMPVMVELITAAQARQEAEEEAAADEMEAQFEAEDFFLRGMTADDLEAIMTKIFKDHDEDGNGSLDRKEFKACLNSADLGLTRKEINMLLSEADEDGNGVVDYEEFIPLCFKILVEKFKEDYLRTKALQEAGELEAIMLDEFVAQGLDPSGKMSRKKVKKVMENINADFFGLSRVQIVTVLGLAEADGQGEVDVARFLRSAQNMLFKLMESTKQNDKAAAIENLAKTEGAEMLHTMSGEEVKEALQSAFQAVDVDHKGWLTPDEVYEVLEMFGTGTLQMEPYQINAMVNAVDENDDGVVEWEELVDFVYDVLTHLDRDFYVMEMRSEELV